jgi:hypothetical protein
MFLSTTHFVCNAFTVSSGTKTSFGTYLGCKISSNRSRTAPFAYAFSFISTDVFISSKSTSNDASSSSSSFLLLRSCDDDDDDDDADDDDDDDGTINFPIEYAFGAASRCRLQNDDVSHVLKSCALNAPTFTREKMKKKKKKKEEKKKKGNEEKVLGLDALVFVVVVEIILLSFEVF